MHVTRRLTTIMAGLFCSFLLQDTAICQSTAHEQVALDTLFKGLKFRNIGPFRGGRSVASCGVIGDDQTYYMGSTGGGIWKTTDAGINWANISDGQLKTGSVGAIEVAPSDPNVIYAGMGEHPVRGVMTSHGDGVYKSTDAGRTWSHMGLSNTRHIAEIRIHPSDSDMVYVAAQGAVHGDSEDRGVYKSSDGGLTWTKVLYVDQTTGASDLTMDMANPRILFASMWDHRRYPWQVRSGGDGSAIYKSTDSGETWERVSGGLPEAMGKSAVDISAANPNVVYANIEAEGTEGGVYRSNDGGKKWTQTTSNRVTVARAWYYIEIFADPQNEDVVYVLNAPVLKSIDGGKSFKSVRNPHGDQHHMWINPNNPKNILLSNDGGACISFNGGQSWSSQSNQPTIQFYRVITDNLFPYNIYGGQQDNSSIITASRTTGAGITWKDWQNGPGCESAFLAFDPDNPVRIFGGCYQGNISVMDKKTGEQKDVMAYPTVGLGWTPGDMKYRFNWNAPIVASPQDYNTIYHGGNKVLVTRDGGQSWDEISPDLTRNDKDKQGKGGAPYTNEGAGGEVYNTLSYIEASPHSSEVLWTGSDCGLVHVTTDGGDNWTNVTPKDLGEALINCIDVSPHDPATAYIVATKYKFNDFTPMIYKTTNYGKKWQKIIAGIAAEDFVRVVREDEKVKGLLYAGTETGLYISYDDGRMWERCQLNLPVCPITDMTFQDNDLVVATSGRSFWILDDLGAIQTGRAMISDKTTLIAPKDSYRVRGSGRSRPGQVMGKNPASGITFDFFVPFDMSDTLEAALEVIDEDGLTIRTYRTKKPKDFKSYVGGPSAPRLLPFKSGVNRFNWDMRRSAVTGVNGVFLLGGYSGAMAPPGRYTLRLKVGDSMTEVPAILKADPRIEATPEDYKNQYEAMLAAEMLVKEVQEDVTKMRTASAHVEALKKMLKGKDGTKDLLALAESLTDRMETWEADLIQPDQKTFQDVINFPNKLNAEASDLMGRMGGMEPRLTEGMKQRLSDLQAQYQKVTNEKNEIINQEFKALNDAIRAAGVDLISFPG